MLRVVGNRAGPVFVVVDDAPVGDSEEIVTPSFPPIAALGPINEPIVSAAELSEFIVPAGDLPGN